MRVLIVDDERPARDKLRRLLEQEADISAIGEARDGIEALECLAGFAPDVLLLDIQMPEVSGLDVAASLPSPAPLVVFVTAYDEYAIRAFDANAIDYLLKPYDQQRLQRALARVRERLAQQRASAVAAAAQDAGGEQLTAAAHGASAGSATVAAEPAAEESTPTSLPLPPVTQLLVPIRGGTRVVRIEELQWIETADNYVLLHLADGSELLMRQTLAGLVGKLGPRFLRCHRRAAVQLDWISTVQMADKGDADLLLRGGAIVPCSRQYRPDIVQRLQSSSRAAAPPAHC